MKKGKKALFYGICIAASLIAVFVYYYITLPAINIHSSGFWFFLLALIAAAAAVYAVRKAGKEYRRFGKAAKLDWKSWKLLKLFAGIFIAVLAVYLIGDLLSSPIINAKKYQQLLAVEERNFTDDIKEVDYSTIPLLDKDSATLLGDRKMGSLVEMVSQFEAADDYTQINYQGKPVRVTPLVYASPIKWLTNQSKGIPAYIMIDMTTQDTEVVMLEEGSNIPSRNISTAICTAIFAFAFRLIFSMTSCSLKSMNPARPIGSVR